MEASGALALFLAVVAAAVLLSRLRKPVSSLDRDIKLEIGAAIQREYPLAGIQVDVKSFGGAVILGGFVREQQQLVRAVEIARATPGVKTVESRISVTPGG